MISLAGLLQQPASAATDHVDAAPGLSPHPKVPASAGLEGGLQLAARSLEPSFEAAIAAPQDEAFEAAIAAPQDEGKIWSCLLNQLVRVRL